MYSASSMLPVAVLMRPMAHGLTMPLVMPTLLITAMPPARASAARYDVGIAQKIGSAANSRTVAVDSRASAATRLPGCVVSAASARAPPVAQMAK